MFRPIATGIGVWLMMSGLSAHHSDAAFDPHDPITLQGIVTKFIWENPHIWVYLEAKDADGRLVTWAVEGNPPGRIGGQGMKDAVKIGDQVRITAYKAKDPSRRYARGYDLTLLDGRRFIIGSVLSSSRAGRIAQPPIQCYSVIRRHFDVLARTG